MNKTVTLTDGDQTVVNFTSQPFKADGWHGQTGCLYTLVLRTNDFRGKVWVEACLDGDPQTGDWFPIKIEESPFILLPARHHLANLSSTETLGWTFKVNTIWLRIRTSDVTQGYLAHASLSR